MYRIACSEVWGGNEETNSEVCTGTLTASLYSRGVDGGDGGDVYYFSVCDGDKLSRIAIADVAGHGKAVSDAGSWLYDSMSEQKNCLDGYVVLADLNNQIRDHKHRTITTAEVVGYYKANSRLYFSYAGHPPALIKRRGESVWRPIAIEKPSARKNIPLGIFDNATFDEESIPAESGDLLFLYTDGVIEAPGKDGKQLGLKRLLYMLESISSDDPRELKDAVLERLLEDSGDNFYHDDVTLMAVRIN